MKTTWKIEKNRISFDPGGGSETVGDRPLKKALAIMVLGFYKYPEGNREFPREVRKIATSRFGDGPELQKNQKMYTYLQKQ
jgi:hypothetical protein